ncbi:hypothetical protein VPH35_056543 [Triticum aestivum]
MGRFWTCSIQIQQIYRTIVIHFIRRVHLGEWKRHTSCPEPTDILHVVPNLQNLATIGAVPNKVTTADFINSHISKVGLCQLHLALPNTSNTNYCTLNFATLLWRVWGVAPV